MRNSGNLDKEVQSCCFNNEKILKRDVFYCIAYMTHKCPLLQQLFAKWTCLNNRQQLLLHYIVRFILNDEDLEIFSGIMKGIRFWDNIQNTEGACGYSKNPLEFRFDAQQEKEIFRIINYAIKIINTLINKGELCTQISLMKICSFKGKLIVVSKFNAAGDT